MFYYNIFKKENDQLIQQNDLPLSKEEAYDILYKKEDEANYIIRLEMNKSNLEKYGISEKTYDFQEVRTRLINEESFELDKIVNTILANFVGLEYIFDNDTRENFIKGCIVNDYSYCEDLMPEGNTIQFYSEDLFTESFKSLNRVHDKISRMSLSEDIKFTIDYNNTNKVKSNIAKQMAYLYCDFIIRNNNAT